MEDLLASTVKYLFEKTYDKARKEIGYFKDVDKALRQLHDTFVDAQNLFTGVDNSQFQADEFLQSLMNNLIGLCYDADDLIYDITSAGSNSMVASPQLWTKPRRLPKLKEKLDGVKNVLKQLMERVKKPETTPKPCNGHFFQKLEKPLNGKDGYYCQKSESPLIGRGNDIDTIVQELASCAPGKGISIVGVSGLGKTALAQAILHERKIVESFSDRFWVCMPNWQNLQKDIEEYLAAECKQKSSLSMLIAFDNLLDVEENEWSEFLSYTRHIEIKFLITTSDPRISQLTGTKTYYLKPLSLENFKVATLSKLHTNGPSDSSLSHLDSISTEKWETFVETCEGLPLVAGILGSALASCDEHRQYTLLMKDLWASPEFEFRIFPVLRSSYQDLSPHLKQCLTYLSLFPLNHQFNIDDLIRLYTGEGFVMQLAGKQNFEWDADNCIYDLVKSSILQVSDEGTTYVGKPRFKLNKLSHKFAQSTSSSIYQLLDMGEAASHSLDGNTRHLSLSVESIASPLFGKIMELKGLRSFLCLNVGCEIHLGGQLPIKFFKALRRLRVLVLNKTDIVRLPDGVEKLKHLKYLDISSTPIQNLPRKLSNLQFLKLRGTVQLKSLPTDFDSLTNLLWVDWEVSDVERLAPRNIGRLSSLRSLPLFLVGKREGYFITELKNMDSLQGSICIRDLDNVKDGREAKETMLENKLSLRKLELEWNKLSNNMVAKDVLTNLKPHSNLKELHITKYGSNQFPEWLNNECPMLEKIHLKECQFCDVLPAFGQLRNLKILILEKMSGLKDVDFGPRSRSSSSTGGHFPLLEKLEFNGLATLQKWTGLEANDMPLLKVLEIKDCRELINLPSLNHLTSLVDLEIEDCPVLESLPELPTSLRSLAIRDCDLLTNRCQVGGADWPKVDCVVEVEINYEKIQTSAASNCLQTSAASNCLPAPPNRQHQNIVFQGYELIKDSAGAIICRFFS